MNIIVNIYGSGKCCCRPDTTWERENRDFYVPEKANSIYWSPIVFARISKAGKCIGSRFAPRYYDAMNFGTLMYIGDMLDGSSEGFACASCADHTSILPFPLYNPVVFTTDGNAAEIIRNGKKIFTAECGSNAEMLKKIESTICKASEFTSLRTGDIVAAELAPVSILASREEGDSAMEATFCGNSLFDFRIIF